MDMIKNTDEQASSILERRDNLLAVMILVVYCIKKEQSNGINICSLIEILSLNFYLLSGTAFPKL